MYSDDQSSKCAACKGTFHIDSKTCVIPLITDDYAFTSIPVIKCIRDRQEGARKGGVVGDGRSGGHDTKDRSKERSQLQTTLESGYPQDHMNRSNLIGQDPLIHHYTFLSDQPSEANVDKLHVILPDGALRLGFKRK